jgi:hypothetical protein
MKLSRLLVWVPFLILSSCVYDNKGLSQVPEARQILLPEGLETYNSALDKTEFHPGAKSHSLKIFTTINVSCATCVLKLDEWKKFQMEAGNCTKVLLVPVCTSKDKFEMLKYLFESNELKEVDFPLLLDSTRAFQAANKQFAGDASGVAVLTDSDNVVMLTGNPIENQTDRQLFLDKICKLNSRQ